MPTTYNGIGTHYYGKWNRSVRTAPCRSCGRAAHLESYDTRLWFVIIFIPVIPLGRKRVIDACPVCTRHFVARADDYEQARQLQVSAAQEEYRRSPSPLAALKLHGTLLAFHDLEQAESLRQSARQKFPADGEMLAGMAAQLDEAAVYGPTAELYEAAHRLRPDLPEVRVALAMRRIPAGQLDEARKLLDFLEVPGASQRYSLGPLDTLARHYQQKRRHEEALELAEHLLKELPSIGQIHEFRKFVASSEKALGRLDSMLPRREHSLRGFFRGDRGVYSQGLRWIVLGLAAVILLAAGLAVNNEYIRRHRTLHVLNSTGAPVEVRVDDGPPQTVADSGQIIVAEGKHRVRLTGPVDETHDLAIEAGFLDRWFKKPAWILMPGGEVPLVRRTVIYALHPVPSNPELIVGRSFFSLPDVDYLFTDPPQSMQVKNASVQVTKTCVQRFLGPDLQAFEVAYATNPQAALTFLEHRLRRKPDDPALMDAYADRVDRDRTGGPEKFLESGLDRRPVVVQWHRLYQSLVEKSGRDQGLVARYDGFLKADPKNAALLYLRARIEPDWDRQGEMYRQAMQADPRLPWPWVAQAARSAAAARWAQCLAEIKEARDRGIDERAIRDVALTARLGAGEARKVADECRAAIGANVADFPAAATLLEATAVYAPVKDVEGELAAWQNRLPLEARAPVEATFRPVAFYFAGKLDQCLEHCRRSQGIDLRSVRLHTLLALGRVKEATEDPTLTDPSKDANEALAISLAWRMAGNAEQADKWLERGIQGLSQMGHDGRLATSALRARQPPPLRDIERIYLGARWQTLICSLLAARFPEQRKDYMAAAERYNVRLGPPHHLVKRAISSGFPATPSSTAAR